MPRNDPMTQAYQPNREQMEWAADLAVRGQLTFQRPANWSNNGLPAYSPQGMFPSLALSGGGFVPAQVFLGILAQESNLLQASFHVVDGLAGNPLTSLGYYGLDLMNPDVTKNVCISRASFHSKDTGAVTYANAVSSRLSAVGYN
ncbi:hypothetical protein ACH4T9_05280 [Micromonospora sp. NPDC020750]|uniref:hypothetical protein n=1 Tax=unclassified Micromonospora TaxID=2617518 RepID=UPI003796C2AF